MSRLDHYRPSTSSSFASRQSGRERTGSPLPYERGGLDSPSPASTSEISRDLSWSTPRLEELYRDETLDFDNDRFGRYSVTSSLSPSPSYNSDSLHSAPQSIHGLLPTGAPALYEFEKEKWANEDDDELHNPGERGTRSGRSNYIGETAKMRSGGSMCSWRGVANLGGMVILLGGLIGLFGECALSLSYNPKPSGYPIASALSSRAAAVNTTSYLTGTPVTPNASSPRTSGIINSKAPIISTRALIDPDTPTSAYTMTGVDGDELELVFSDEFNVDGRTFYPGMDPYFEAVNLHYYATADLEWEDPSNIITAGGHLEITLTKETLANSHNLGYLGGMLQSWNKFCFSGGAVETSVSLPGSNIVSGLWPSVWTMGNLGRPGYGSTTDGVWPYSYESCDIGTLPNQTNPKTGGPAIVTTSGIELYGYELSYLPGQKLSSCTCPGSNHPGPQYANGSYAGRGAPEIDLFEATADSTGGQVSQSAQWAPFNPSYIPINATKADVEFYTTIYDTILNTYLGGAYQMATSALSNTVPTAYNSTTAFSTYGIEYTPSYLGGTGTGNINWLQQGERMWRISDSAMGPDAASGVKQRPVTGEPMSIIMNLGMSPTFGTVDLTKIVFPAVMRVDYIRIYQPKAHKNIGCNNPLFPTTDYINNNIGAYTNPNFTIWGDFNGAVFPTNSLLTACT